MTSQSHMFFGYLYYSKKCEYCRSLMKLMEHHGLFQHFKPMCVDEMDVNELTRLQIENVPTLMLISNSNGNQQIIMRGGDQAFVWVKQFLQGRRQSTIANAEANAKLIRRDDTMTSLTNGVSGCCPEELFGLSDQYAFNKDDVNVPLPKSFVQFDQKNLMNLTAEERIMTVPVGDIKNYKKAESIETLYGKDIKKMISQVEDIRKRQDIDLRSILEQKTVSAVIDNFTKR